MFSDLKKGFQVHTLDTNTVPKYELGKVVAVSEPRYLPPQPGQYQAMQTRVVKATLMYLDDPDAPEGVAFIRWLAVQDYLGEKINWKDLT